jgi:hypothetical protein
MQCVVCNAINFEATDLYPQYMNIKASGMCWVAKKEPE